MGNIVHCTNENFEKTTENATVLVDFYASWCGPCKMLSPILEDLVKDDNFKYDVVKVNIDDCMDIARDFAVMSVPTLVLVKDGVELDRIIGLRDKDSIITFVNNNLKK